ncbi:MAG: Eco57I restriction-modification methylase domain-containing protein [Chitinispirillales bacterium]|jgi:methylase of polypeptide subunit release factors|nr:Eco57I restriction-modification methylase domain-containing protein [Chitinispirillales bacterium]
MGTQNRRYGIIRNIGEIESLRLSMQSKLDSYKSIEERRKLGQFATPTSLARDIISFGLQHLDFSSDIRFFDPAFGTGAFFSALLHEIKDNKTIEKATAVEIDPLFANAADSFWDNDGVNIINSDFTNIMPDGYYNFIICNPPYVRHHLIASESKSRINNKTKDISGVKLSGLAGLYCHFLLQSIQWMDEDAVAGWLIPSEFMDVNYGEAIKEFLLSKVELFRIHRFNPEDAQFGDALVSSAVVWFKKRKPTNRNVTFSYGGSLLMPHESKDISVDSLRQEQKWTRFPCQPQRSVNKSSSKLKDYFDVKRGIATGSNDFFIIEKSRIFEMGLPFEFFRPVLPSARYVKTTEINSDEQGNPILPQQLFLLDCRLSEDGIKKDYPRLWQYLESGKNNVANGYLCKTRKCWYFQEQREAPIFICTYMGRVTDGRNSAFRFILNNSNATVTNSYLALYPRKNLLEKFDDVPSLKRTVWELLNEMTSESLQNEGRIYGGGLQKIEPKELLNIDVSFLSGLF